MASSAKKSRILSSWPALYTRVYSRLSRSIVERMSASLPEAHRARTTTSIITTMLIFSHQALLFVQAPMLWRTSRKRRRSGRGAEVLLRGYPETNNLSFFAFRLCFFSHHHFFDSVKRVGTLCVDIVNTVNASVYLAR